MAATCPVPPLRLPRASLRVHYTTRTCTEQWLAGKNLVHTVHTPYIRFHEVLIKQHDKNRLESPSPSIRVPNFHPTMQIFFDLSPYSSHSSFRQIGSQLRARSKIQGTYHSQYGIRSTRDLVAAVEAVVIKVWQYKLVAACSGSTSRCAALRPPRVSRDLRKLCSNDGLEVIA